MRNRFIFYASLRAWLGVACLPYRSSGVAFLESCNRGRLEARTPPGQPLGGRHRTSGFPPIEETPQAQRGAQPGADADGDGGGDADALSRFVAPLSATFPTTPEAGGKRCASSVPPAARFAPAFSSTVEEEEEEEEEEGEEGRGLASEDEGQLLSFDSMNPGERRIGGTGDAEDAQAGQREGVPERRPAGGSGGGRRVGEEGGAARLGENFAPEAEAEAMAVAVARGKTKDNIDSPPPPTPSPDPGFSAEERLRAELAAGGAAYEAAAAAGHCADKETTTAGEGEGDGGGDNTTGSPAASAEVGGGVVGGVGGAGGTSVGSGGGCEQPGSGSVPGSVASTDDTEGAPGEPGAATPPRQAGVNILPPQPPPPA